MEVIWSSSARFTVSGWRGTAPFGLFGVCSCPLLTFFLWARPRAPCLSARPAKILLGARRDNTNGTANRDHTTFMLFNHNNIVLALKLRVESISEVY